MWRETGKKSSQYKLSPVSIYLRIISGSARGRRLSSPPGQTRAIRPTSDRAREALFNIISNHVEQAVVLDLFAGTGALGLEAFSRGAHSVAFVDNSRLAIDLITKNILTCFATTASLATRPRFHLESSHEISNAVCWTVIQHDLRKGLPLKMFMKKNLSCFDLVFLDPPYSQGLCQQMLQDWDANNLLTANGLLIAEERANEKLETRFSTLDLIDNRVYGDTAFWIFTRKGSDHRVPMD